MMDGTRVEVEEIARLKVLNDQLRTEKALLAEHSQYVIKQLRDTVTTQAEEIKRLKRERITGP